MKRIFALLILTAACYGQEWHAATVSYGHGPDGTTIVDARCNRGTFETSCEVGAHQGETDFWALSWDTHMQGGVHDRNFPLETVQCGTMIPGGVAAMVFTGRRYSDGEPVQFRVTKQGDTWCKVEVKRADGSIKKLTSGPRF